MKPFRWNIKKKEQLGKLLIGERAWHYSGYLQELRECSVKVLARSQHKRMIFVGRSAENIFDYLSGILDKTLEADNLDMLNISNRFYSINELAQKEPKTYMALKEHFILLNIAPKQLIHAKKGICFVDLVCEGSTFDRLFEFIERWCKEEQIDKKSVWCKIKFLGITSRKKNSPNTFRWYQDSIWTNYKFKIETQSISISTRMWDYMGNRQNKVTSTNSPSTWRDERILLPFREDENLKALRLAFYIYTRALDEKKLFVSQLSKTT